MTADVDVDVRTLCPPVLATTRPPLTEGNQPWLAKVTKFGPGTLTLGEVGTPIDVSCQVISCQIEWDKDKDDDVVVLCGETVGGSTIYTAR